MGLVQGLTEFLPVSSTAHLRLVPTLLGQPDAGASFTAVTQLGTLAAVLVYFRHDLFVAIPRGLSSRQGYFARLPWLLAVGTVPIVVAGVLGRHAIRGELRSLYVVAAALVVVGILLYFVDRRAADAKRVIESITMRDALWIGLAQACALVPGVSRSGATLAMALALGLARPAAARFSFLLSVPAIAGAGLLEARSAIANTSDLTAVIVATLMAAVSGYAAIAWLMKYVSTRSLAPFAAYRVAVGMLLLALLLASVVAPIG